MAIVTGFTAERMLAIENNTVIDGYIDAQQHLVLTKHDGTEIDAGDVSAISRFTVEDTETVDLTITGNGSQASPFKIKGDVRNQFYQAILDSKYIGPGPARVTFLSGETPSGSLSSEAYQWLGKYEPWGNRVVTMVRFGSTWAILGHAGAERLGGKLPIPLVNNWQPYNRRQAIPDDRFSMPRVQRLPSGIVVLSGLLGGGTITNGTLIGTLPVGYRPDTTMIFPVNNGDNPRAVSITSTGNITVLANNGVSWVNSYVSLDGIAFPAAGVANWINVGDSGSGSSFQNSWVAFSPATYGPPRYWKDSYGFVWWAGVVASGLANADDIAMINVPAQYGPALQTHSKLACASSFGLTSATKSDTTVGSNLNWKSANTSNAWVSLGGLAVPSVDATSSAQNIWVDLVLANGWARYATNFPAPAVLRRGDGLGVAHGFIRSGTVPGKIANFPNEVGTWGDSLFSGATSTGFGRLDLYSYALADKDGKSAFSAVTGSNVWLSMDNTMWMVGD